MPVYPLAPLIQKFRNTMITTPMTFLNSIPGPSRLPYHSLPLSLPLVRSYAARPIRRPDIREDGQGKPRNPMGTKSAFLLQERDAEYGFQHWLLDYGAEYLIDPKQGGKAVWLGGNIPYPGNPSFRPPPPISNDLQDKVYTEMTKTKKTIGQIAESFNVSKARLEAVRKLKEVEAEFKRQFLPFFGHDQQNKPLQKAFLETMEPLLGVHSIIDRNTKRHSDGLIFDEKLSRAEHPSSVAEKMEEQRYEEGVGEAGAFGKALSERTTKGIETSAWEFRSEDVVGEQTTPITEAAEEITPLADIVQTTSPSVSKASPRTAFRFVDRSSKPSSFKLRKAEEGRESRRARKARST